nr:tripartite tricarboxylate transporter substrate binding protein [Burkholderiaceae bacterium]
MQNDKVKFVRRGLVTVLAFAGVIGSAVAQPYPNKPIRLIVPFPAAGGTDLIARVVSDNLSQVPGFSVIVENKPGAGGNLGVDQAAKAAPDGYTIVLGQTSNLAINPTLYSKLPYDPVKDLAPIAQIASAPLMLVVPASSPFKTLADIVTNAKAKPGEINYGSSGSGTVSHLTMELLQKAAGVKLQHIPYKGSNLAINDIIGGQIQIYVASVPTLLGFIKGGKLRPIVISSAQRVKDLPQVPTLIESGYQGLETSTWFGLLAPAGTPQPVIARLNTEVNRILQQPEA